VFHNAKFKMGIAFYPHAILENGTDSARRL